MRGGVVMNEIADAFKRWRADGEAIAMATVIAVDGSAPRGPGAKMLVTGSGKIAGSVSGGCVEGAVAEEASAVLRGGAPVIVKYGINRDMMWDVGLACGGTIDVFIESLERGMQPSFDPGATACTVVRGPDRVGARVRVRRERDGTAAVEGSTGSADLDAAIAAASSGVPATASARIVSAGRHEIFVDPCTPAQRLLIVGAVHIGVALCEYATRAGFEVIVLDPRERLNNSERFPAAAKLVVGWPEEELPALEIDENTYVAVLTHDEKFDDPTLDFVLRGPARYVGAIGSKKTQAKRRARLLGSGITVEAVDRLHAPIGLDIGADTPEEIAIAVLAEAIASKHGHRGAPLSQREALNIHS
jgi:xanthine dehydrogenase accessory factor